MTNLPLNEGDKFALLAFETVRTNIGKGERGSLNDGTQVLPDFPAVLDAQPHWKEWLGSLRVERLGMSNLVLLRSKASSRPEILDDEHDRLDNYLTKLFYLLRLALVIEYGGADILVGSFLKGEAQVRRVSKVPAFRWTRGSLSDPVTVDSLQRAADRVGGLEEMEAAFPKYGRVIRGLNTLTDGLRYEHGQDRIHQFVRSLEALILPDRGKTQRQFVDRCQTFAQPRTEAEKTLKEAFDMRSDTEHMHDWDRSLQSYAEDDRENIALQRTRQMERLACFAYCRILDDPALRKQFANEAAQADFWTHMDDAARRKCWGEPLNIGTIPLVRHYDQWGRAAPHTD